jgi:hypothetical protein
MNGVCLVIQNSKGESFAPVYECHTPESLADIVMATVKAMTPTDKLLAIKVG